MIPVNQTRKGIGGNCFAACVASILEEPIEEIDHLVDMEESNPESDWLNRLHDHFKEDGLSIAYVEIKDGVLPMRTGHDFFCIIGGVTNNGIPHAVVGKMVCNGEENHLMYVHDPEPESSGFKEVTGIWFFVKSF